jgi:hypothetical protein
LAEVGRQLRASRQTVQKFERAEATDRITLGTLPRRRCHGMRPYLCALAEVRLVRRLAEHPVRERASRDVKNIHTMALEDQKPENANQLIEDEVRRRLNEKSK